MEYRPSSSKTPLRNLRIARSLSQEEVAEAIGTNANTVSRWERGVATPSPYYRRKLAEYFAIDPQELFSDLNGETEKTTVVLPPKPETAGDLPNEIEGTSQTEKTTEGLLPETGAGLPDKTESASQGPPAWRRGPSLPPKIPRRVYIPVASIMIFTLVLGCVLVLPSLLHQPASGLFPALCSGNFQSTNTSIVNMPATSTSPDGEPIGLSEGANTLDLQRPNQQEVQDKLQAAQDWVNDPQDVVSSLNNTLSIDQTDAEAQIYLENWKVLGSNHPHITLVVGVSFIPSFVLASRSTLQGAYTAQKECNDHNRLDNRNTQVVLMIANVGGDSNGNIANESAKFVADQIVDQAREDSTIVGIMGWPLSPASIDVQTELHAKGSDLPMLAACSSSDDLTGTYHFSRICPADAQQSPIAANFLLNKMQKKRISIIYDSTTSFANSLRRDFFNEILKAKGNIVGQESYTGGNQSDLQTALTNALAQKPDAIFFAGYASDLTDLLNAIPQANKLLVMGGNALAITNTYTNPLPDMHNVYFTAFASPNEWDGADSKPPLFQEYRANFGTLTAPTHFPSIDTSVMLGYDAMSTLLHASQQALSKHNDTITPSYLEDELKQITEANPLQGVTGRIAFDSNGNQDEHKMIFVEHIEGNKLVIDEKHGCLLKDNCGP